MDVTTVRTMLNTEPHHFEATFDKPYDQITANDVLDLAAMFLEDYFATIGCRHLFPGKIVSMLFLRYLKKEDAFVISSEHHPGSPISEEYPSEYTLMAANWYWKTGYNLSSRAIDADSLLGSVSPLPDATAVRWYILLSRRNEYMNLVRQDVDKEIKVRPTWLSKVSKNVTQYLPKQQASTPASNSPCPKSNYGPNPVTLVPIFAEAYNMLAHPESVELEVGTREGTFDIHRNVSRFILAVREQPNDEKVFSAGISVILKDLLDFLDLELHYSVNDCNRRQVAEIDSVGFCHTAHRMMCVPFSGKSREEYGTGGDSIAQNILALKRLLAEFWGCIKLTACPILILAVEGTYVRVEAMCFSTEVYSVELFTANLKEEQSPKERYALAAKFQVVRNTVRKLCEFYTNLHAAMRPPTAPYLFPQPLSLLQCLIPSPAPEVVHRLSSLNLNILQCDDTSEHWRPLYKGVISPEPSRIHRVYVKIVSGEYGVTAHELLAQQDPPLAPKLYWCGAITAGHTMVIMEELPLNVLDYDYRGPHPRKYNQDDIDIVERDIGRAVEILHEHDLVHGDLRDPNMIIAYGRGYLIDFDAAGVEGVAKYPPSLNPKIVWPADPYNLLSMPISKEDDKARFKRTVEELLGKHDALPRKRGRDSEDGLKRSKGDHGTGSGQGFAAFFKNRRIVP
uniref:N/A n=1 Tax=Ganoderma boninense TaxID=34458 RepID=A0A5K1JWP8_9APHY|nr:N/A [Ganoderma boninense]